MSGVKGRSGGARVGAGRKKRAPGAAWLTGARRRGPQGVVKPAAVVPDDSGTVVRPKGLSVEDTAVWNELAPLALALGTLTVATAMAFADLCGYIVMERKMRVAPLAAGGPDHRGLIQRIETMRARFRLIADGKPVVKPETTGDEWSEFDGPTLVKGART